MLGFLKRLFVRRRDLKESPLSIKAFLCETPVKLPEKVRTPLGGNVSVVNVWVDIEYNIDGGAIVLQNVCLSRVSGLSMNVSSVRTGEGWLASAICPASHLAEAVRKDLSTSNSRLKRMMLGQYRSHDRRDAVQPLVDALNARRPAKELEQLFFTVPRGSEIVFTYAKPDGSCSERRVSIQAVEGNVIKAVDHKDNNFKCFRADRMSNVCKAYPLRRTS